MMRAYCVCSLPPCAAALFGCKHVVCRSHLRREAIDVRLATKSASLSEGVFACRRVPAASGGFPAAGRRSTFVLRRSRYTDDFVQRTNVLNTVVCLLTFERIGDIIIETEIVCFCKIMKK